LEWRASADVDQEVFRRVSIFIVSVRTLCWLLRTDGSSSQHRQSIFPSDRWLLPLLRMVVPSNHHREKRAKNACSSSQLIGWWRRPAFAFSFDRRHTLAIVAGNRLMHHGDRLAGMPGNRRRFSWINQGMLDDQPARPSS